MPETKSPLDLDTLTRSALGGGSTVGLQKSLDSLRKTQEEKDRALDPAREQLQETVKAGRAEIDAKKAAIEPLDAHPWDADAERKKYTTDPIEAFGSFGSAFGMLASLFTATPMTNSLNAAAAALNAVKQNDERMYKSAFEAWDKNANLAITRHNIQHEEYEDAIKLLNTDIAAGSAMIKVLSAKYEDRVMSTLNEAGLYEQINAVHQARAHSAAGVLAQLPQLQEFNLKYEGYKSDPRSESQDPNERLMAYQQWFNPYMFRSQSGGNTLTAERMKIFNDWKTEFAAKNNREPNAEERMQKLQEITKGGLTGNQADKLRQQVDMYGNALDKLDESLGVLDQYVGAAGLAGRGTRLAERVSNIFGGNQTDRVQFEHNIQYLQAIGGRLLTASQGRPLAAEASKLNAVIAGLNMGDTTANTIRALEELRALYMKMRLDTMDRLSGEWTPDKEGRQVPPPPASGSQPWQSDPVVGGAP